MMPAGKTRPKSAAKHSSGMASPPSWHPWTAPAKTSTPAWRDAPRPPCPVFELPHAAAEEALCYAPGQALIFFAGGPSASGREGGGEGTGMLGVVDESGRRIKRVASKLDEPETTYPLAMDGAIQSVFPWPRNVELGSALQAVKQAAHDATMLARIGRHLKKGEDPPQAEQHAPPASSGELIDQPQLQLKCAEARRAELKLDTVRAAIAATRDALHSRSAAATSASALARRPSVRDSPASESPCESPERPVTRPSVRDGPARPEAPRAAQPEASLAESQEVLEERLRKLGDELGTAEINANAALAAAKDVLEVAAKTALAISNAMLVDVATVQSARLKAVLAVLPEYAQLRDANDAAAIKSRRELGDVTKLLGAARALREGVGQLDLDALAAEGLRVKGGLGLRRYGAGQPLVVWQEWPSPRWVDCVVSHALLTGAHVLTLQPDERQVTMKLTPWNHAPRLLSRGLFEERRLLYLQTLLDGGARGKGKESGYSHSEGVNGKGKESGHGKGDGGAHGSGLALALGVRLELLPVRVKAFATPADSVGGAHTVGALSEWLHVRHAAWCTSDSNAPQEADHNVLLTAGVGGGKTLAIHTLATLAAQRTKGDADPNLVPIVISVAKLAHWMAEEGGEAAFGRAWNFADAYVAREHGRGSETYTMLRQAMLARRALLLIDGLDEGGAVVGDRIRRHVAEVLAQQGHLMVVTARSGATAAVLATFQHVVLRPCTEALQMEMMVRGGLAEEHSLSLLTAFRSMWPASTLIAPGRCASSASAAPGAAAGALMASEQRVVAGALVASEQRIDDEACSLLSTPLLLTTLVAMVRRHARRQGSPAACKCSPRRPLPTGAPSRTPGGPLR